MNHYSHEYLEKLIAEHRLISATIATLSGSRFSIYVQAHTQEPVRSAIYNLRVKKVELEGMIDTLSEYLTQ